jgi:hypothetical protein
MHVVAFAPSRRLDLLDVGGVRADGFPITGFRVDNFPEQITLPLVLAVYTEKGIDYDPLRYIVARSPRGERLNVLETTWHWPDDPGQPVKFWVSTHTLPLLAASPGVYTIGLYDSPDATQSDHLFPLPVARAINPLLVSPPPQQLPRLT